MSLGTTGDGGREPGLVYLATPYSHDDISVMLDRFDKVNEAAAYLMSHGIHIYSPISHTHPISRAGNLPGDWEYWEKHDRKMLSYCDRMIVFMQHGWKDSVGVTAEIKIAEEMNIPIIYVKDFDLLEATK